MTRCAAKYLGVGVAGLKAAHESLGELGFPDLQGGAHHLGEQGGVDRGVAGTRVGLDLGKERRRSVVASSRRRVVASERSTHQGGRAEAGDDHLRVLDPAGGRSSHSGDSISSAP